MLIPKLFLSFTKSFSLPIVFNYFFNLSFIRSAHRSFYFPFNFILHTYISPIFPGYEKPNVQQTLFSLLVVAFSSSLQHLLHFLLLFPLIFYWDANLLCNQQYFLLKMIPFFLYSQFSFSLIILHFHSNTFRSLLNIPHFLISPLS